jgi:hypothetical protein
MSPFSHQHIGLTSSLSTPLSCHHTIIHSSQSNIPLKEPVTTVKVPTPFELESDDLDSDAFVILEDGGKERKERGQFPVALLPEIIQRIYRSLDQDEDILNLDQVLSIEPGLEKWRALAYKYGLANDADIKANIRTLLGNLKRKPQDRYPYTHFPSIK